VETKITEGHWSGEPVLFGVSRDITERRKAEAERERLLVDLMYRGTQLITAAEISTSASTMLDPEQLIGETVDLIQERFRFYYVGLFLKDEAGEYAVLQAGTGQAGREMVAAGHKLEVGGESMIGRCVANAQTRIALDVGEEAVRFNNPYLPKTRSEMALPLISRGECIGALTVQSTEEAAFSVDDVAALQSMADQLAIALTNARLYDQVQRYATQLEDLVNERTADLAAVNKELEAFAYSVSHDLRTPLRSIDGFSQALLEDYEDELDTTGQDYLRRVRAASQRMGQLIDDLLSLSRLTRQEIGRERVDLSALAKTIAVNLQERQPERQVEFVIERGIVAIGDKHLLRIVLENLMGNAWKFTSKHPRARIEFGVTKCDGQTAYFVRDDGAGFDMAYVHKLFGAFQRLHGIADFEGSGIGLATVQRIVHRHGGRIWAEGAVEQGARFCFTL
jgi:signal transduction histidine kinase